MANFEKILSSFYVQDSLNSKIWENPDSSDSTMIESVREKLLQIANEFVNFLGVEIFVQDIHMTGSLANYNWSDFSDVDLHILYDFQESGDQKELLIELFKLKKTLFNSTHNIKVRGFDVEMYVQDTTELHFSTGVYSVLFDEWIAIPSKDEVSIDEDKLKSKVESWMDLIDTTIDEVEDDELDDAMLVIDGIKEKLKKYRSIGLGNEGEYSYENLTFKFLRRNGYIQKLFDFTNELMDKRLSLEQNFVE
jgi:hypothetical protein